MTVCIAALGDGGKGAVVVSDRMTTSYLGSMQYQWQAQDVQKIFTLPSGDGAILMAGNDSFARSIIANAMNSIRDNAIEGIEAITEVIRDEYQKYRLANFVQNHLQTKGLTLESYYEQHSKLGQTLVQFIDSNISTWSVLVDLIVTGRDSMGNFHIYSISHPGISLNHDSSGYACIGMGGPHAMYYLIGSNYSRTAKLDEVQKIVLEAKRKAEAAPGVGNLTADDSFPKVTTPSIPGQASDTIRK